MANILVIDDDEMLCDTLCRHARYMEHHATHALSLSEGFEKLGAMDVDVVFLDVRLPDGNGLSALPQIQGIPTTPEVIIITGEGDPDGAELAIKSGAWDYLEKPLSMKNLSLQLARVLDYREKKKTGQPPVALKTEGIVGNSPRIRHCLDLVAQAAGSDANVLITGNSGTGKELFATAIHANSKRAVESLVVVDCGALPDTLVEGLLFGHERGAFTGAAASRDGLVLQADKGTLFLDEIGELPLGVQSSFLRVLQERRFRPVGGPEEVASDFRLIAATNRNLDEMVREGLFRSDLLFRIRAITIELPPLRERTDDIKSIAVDFVTSYCEREGIASKGLSPEFVSALKACEWPGNVRELINALQGAVNTARSDHTLYPHHLPIHIRAGLARASVRPTKSCGSGRTIEEMPSLREFREASERQYLQELLSLADGDVREAIEASGVSQSRFYALLKKHAIRFRGN